MAKWWKRALASTATLAVLAAEMHVAPVPSGAATGPNGRIAYSSWDAESNYDIYVVDPAMPSSPPVRVTTDGQYNSNPDWSPDGTRIAYDGWAGKGGPHIQVMDADPTTADSRVISDPCALSPDCYGDFQPEWSPDGTRIAFVSSRPNADGSPNWSYELYVMDATGEVGPLPDATRLTTDALPESGQGVNDSQLTWSPDGRRIAFLSSGRGDDPDSCDMWLMDSQDLDGDGFGDNLERLTFDEGRNCDAFEDFSPQWSPNSSLIAFTSTRSGYFDIWVVNADDPTDLRNVTQTPEGYEDQPGWSPDGTQIIFRGTADGAYELFSLPVPPPAAVAVQAGDAAPVEDRFAAAATTIAAIPEPTQLTFDGRTKQQADWGRAVAAPTRTKLLTVTKTAGGQVRSTPVGIACGRDCTEAFTVGTQVTLKAVPKAGYRFKRWTGDCRSTAATCTVTMDTRKTVAATFAPVSG